MISLTKNASVMVNVDWYNDTELWVAEMPVIFNRNRIMITGIEVAQMIKLLNLQENANILDVGCGVGRHSLEFTRNGYKVTGIDITQPYLDHANEKARADNLKVRFLRCDMRDFLEPDNFDLIVCMFNSFGFFEDQNDDRKVIDNAVTSLKKGGRMLIEMLSKDIIAADFKEKDSFESNGYLVHTTNKIIGNWDRIEFTWAITKDGYRKEVTHSHRIYTEGSLKQLLESCGFSDIASYGSFTGSPYDQLSKRLIVVGTK